MYPSQIQSVAISAASSGNNTIVAAVTGKIINVIGCFLMASGTVTAKFQSAAGGTDLMGGVALTAQTGFMLPLAPAWPNETIPFWFRTVVSELLNLNLSGAVQVSGSLTYMTTNS